MKFFRKISFVNFSEPNRPQRTGVLHFTTAHKKRRVMKVLVLPHMFKILSQTDRIVVEVTVFEPPIAMLELLSLESRLAKSRCMGRDGDL